jgi:thiamine monophosphate synthase
LVAIGGINYQNMDSVLSLGYETIALSKGIFFEKNLENIIKNLNEEN